MVNNYVIIFICIVFSGDKKHECRVCKKRYYQNGNLQEHMRIHTGVKPFKCEYCSVAFRTSSQVGMFMYENILKLLFINSK